MGTEIPEQAEIDDVHRCEARGCPLHGTMKNGVAAGGTWVCRFHFRAAPAQWPMVTGAILAAQRDEADIAGYVKQALRSKQQASVIEDSDVAVL